MQHTLLTTSLSTSLVLLCACSSGGEEVSPAFQMRSSTVAAASNTPVEISGGYIAFLAAEDATGTAGTDLNGDGDLADRVAHVVNAAAATEFRLGVAADNLAWAGAQLYLAVDEGRDGNDWNADGDMTDAVLLHWSEATPTLTVVDLLASSTGTPMAALPNRLVYAAATGGAGIGDSTLRFLEAATPTTLVAIQTQDTVGPLSPRILGQDENLVFLGLDETVEGRDLNGDADSTDTRVLALLDGTSNTSLVRSTGLAVRGDQQPVFRADAGVAGDWRVAFLVSEADQSATSLNSALLFGASYRPAHCGVDDLDTLDQVLFVLGFAAWDADPVANPPLNHGLPGRDRIAFTTTHVATIVAETDDGCDLNNDGNSTDRVVRWMPIADDAGDLFLPVNTVAQIKALADVPGGGHGLYELSNQLVIVASEAQGGDIDGNNGLDSDLIGRLAPSLGSTWSFLHGENDDVPISTTWVAPSQSEGFLGLASEERLANVPLNLGDMDVNDSVPAFATFSSGHLRFPFVRYALDKDSAGIVVSGSIGFWRLSENEDNRDLNSDGDKNDLILSRTYFSNGATVGMSVASDLPRGVIDLPRHGTPFCAAFLALESMQGAAGIDFNADGDRVDLVLRYFRL
jgi:hypothetical protein